MNVLTFLKYELDIYILLVNSLACIFRIPKGENANVGTVVSAVVEHVTPSAVIVNVNASFKGAIYNEHLADYHGKI